MNGFAYLGEALALGSALAWAFGVILFKKSGETVHPISLNLFKNVLALLLYPPTLLILGQPLLHTADTRTYVVLLASGFLGMGVSDTFHFMGLNRVGAGLFSIITTLYAPIVIGLSMVLLGERLTLIQWLGVVLILGAVLMVTGRAGFRSGGTVNRKDLLLGSGYLLIGMVAMAISVVMVKPVLDEVPVVWATQMRLAGGLFFLLPLIAIRRDRGTLISGLVDKRGLKFMIPGSLLGTYIALLLLIGGLKHALASTATVLNQTANLFIFLLAVFLLREPVNPVRVAGILLGVLGAVLVTFG